MRKVKIIAIGALFVFTNICNAGAVSVVPTLNTADLCMVLQNNLYLGLKDKNSNKDISFLQDFLRNRGFLESESTGYFGLLTFKAVKDFQKSVGLASTGFVGQLTRGEIQKMGCKSIVMDVSPEKIKAISEYNNNLPSSTIKILTPKTSTDAFVASDVLLSVQSVAFSDIDKAGPWGMFGPGKSNLGLSQNDLFFDCYLSLGSDKTIKSLEIISDDGWQGWSTKSGAKNKLGTSLYPLVIYLNGLSQINNDYDVALGSYKAGRYNFTVYAQPESGTFNGGEMTIEFSDGTYFTADIQSAFRNINADQPFYITFPGEDSDLYIGNKYQIKWVGQDIRNNYEIYLSGGILKDNTIFIGNTNDNQPVIWNISTSTKVGNDYVIKFFKKSQLMGESRPFNILIK